ncbi:Putative phosphatase [Olavius sp. associated proteobacterium Delta 1]|nr:Putative phosphatase [Olavius sp. associated proteobacterium Delta 1]
MQIKLPELSLVVMIGPSGSGKSTFASKYFLPTEIVSSDSCRGMISDDENDQTITSEAFDLVHTIIRKRLALGRLTVVDATNVQREARKPLVSIARKYHCLPVAIIFDFPEKICKARNQQRKDRNFGPHVIRQQRSQLRRSIKGLKREGFRHIFTIDSEEKANTVTIAREPLWNNKKELVGPFDIFGDIHGCCDELEILLSDLGYVQKESSHEDETWGNIYYYHPEGRKAIFLGDLVDRGPRVLDTLRLIRNMVHTGNALCVPGNHDIKFLRKLWGKKVQITHGLDKTLAEYDALSDDIREHFRQEAVSFIHGLVSHYVLDDGKLVIAHAGMSQEMQGRGSGKVREFALYGETTGETDEFGLPVRYNWAADYRGPATVVYGHTPVPEPEWLNRTVNIDTGCVFGGELTALRYPEKEFVSVPALKMYAEPSKPFLPDHENDHGLTTQQALDSLLEADDVIGKRIVSTRLRKNITIREENATAALEVMSRYAADPKWLIYLPPTMSPCETSSDDAYLEYPGEAFDYYRSSGVTRVVCEEKHMGSRAIAIVCQDEKVARDRFGVEDDGSGIVFTRTGRRFFNDKPLEENLIEKVKSALDKFEFWNKLETQWVCLDCELMPWSAKAQELLKSQYAAVGSSATAALTDTISALEQVAKRNDLEREFTVPKSGSSQPVNIEKVLGWYENRLEMVQDYQNAYRHYCWPVESIHDLKLAPFHVLATEKCVHVDKDHEWHMTMINEFCMKDSDILLSTPYKIVDLNDPNSQQEALGWWEELTGQGGEGMVVKPYDFIAIGKRGLIQPAVKVRGKEYLRIIYGPEYTAKRHMDRLRARNLGRKRSLALREFALGIESLERFVRKEPLRYVHECVFGVLALESESVDPRL